MTYLNTLPIEMFLEKARIAVKSNQKSLNLDIKEVQALYDSLATTMTRLAGSEKPIVVNNPTPESIQVKMDGGRF
jgi:hypothetical protein